MIMVTCFSAVIDLETKKSRAVFLKSIITAGEISPLVKTGALAKGAPGIEAVTQGRGSGEGPRSA